MSALRDFYLRPETDPTHQKDQLEVYDDLESTLQQVKMTLFTNKGDVLGEPEFGVQVEKYLFEFSTNPFELSKEASGQINRYCGEARKRNIEVQPASYEDSKSNREVFVLLVNIPEVKNQLAIFYD